MKIINNYSVIILLCIAFVFLGYGRYVTFHDTEGEALINGWLYWIATLIFSGLALLINFIQRKL